MDPATLGITVAGLVAKRALEAAGSAAGQSGWEALSKVADRLHGWFGSRDEQEALAALKVLEQAPDSQHAQQKLAGKIERAAAEDPQGAAALREAVQQAEEAGPAQVANLVTQVRDQAKVGRIINVGGDYHE